MVSNQMSENLQNVLHTPEATLYGANVLCVKGSMRGGFCRCPGLFGRNNGCGANMRWQPFSRSPCNPSEPPVSLLLSPFVSARSVKSRFPDCKGFRTEPRHNVSKPEALVPALSPGARGLKHPQVLVSGVLGNRV